jgi:hypothetical protein
VKLAAVLGVLGVVMLVGLVALPAVAGEPPWLAVAFQRRSLDGIVLVLGALVPVAITGLAFAGGELVRWQAALATAAFGLLFVKFRGWEQLPAFGALALSTQMIILASIAGIAVSLVGLVRAARS